MANAFGFGWTFEFSPRADRLLCALCSRISFEVRLPVGPSSTLASEVGTAATDGGVAPPSTGARASRRPISGSSRACRGIAMGRAMGRGASAPATAASFAPRNTTTNVGFLTNKFGFLLIKSNTHFVLYPE